MPAHQLPKNLVDAVASEKIVLFIGAGMSMPLGLPSWKKLIEELLENLRDNGLLTSDLHEAYTTMLRYSEYNEIQIVDSLIKRFNAKRDVFDFLEKRIDVDFEDSQLTRHSKLWEITDRIITTNFDHAIQQIKPKKTKIVKYSSNMSLSNISSEGNSYLLYLHGDISDPDSCLISTSQFDEVYKRVGDREHPAVATLFTTLMSYTVVFLGYSLNDPDLRRILRYRKELFNDTGHSHYIVSKENRDDYGDFGVRHYPLENYDEALDQFLESLSVHRKKKGNH